MNNGIDTYKGEPVIEAEYTELPATAETPPESIDLEAQTLPEPISMDERELVPIEGESALGEAENSGNDLAELDDGSPSHYEMTLTDDNDKNRSENDEKNGLTEYEFQPELVDDLLDDSEPVKSEICAAPGCGEVLLPGKANWRQINGEWLPFGSTCVNKVNDAEMPKSSAYSASNYQPKSVSQEWPQENYQAQQTQDLAFYEKPENSIESTLATAYPSLARTNPQGSQESRKTISPGGSCGCKEGGNGPCIEVNIYNYGELNIYNQTSCG